VLIVDDEKDIVDLVAYNLARNGYETVTATDGNDALDSAAKNAPDLIILDLMLPGLDGMEVARRLKADAQTANIPIVMLTAKGEETDVVVGLTLGADDYVTKPFGMDELMARLRTALRHRLAQEGAVPLFRHGELEVDLVRRRVRVRGEEVRLSPREWDILVLLVAHAGRVLTHRFILARLWGAGGDVQQLRVYVRQIRQKIEADPERPRHILTETGVGYRLAEQETEP
jgi:two-component system KDP operon response regulator KdpE